jgi:hypothetical protein
MCTKRYPAILWLIAALPAAAQSIGVPDIEQRYVTHWQTAPVARVRFDQPIQANSARLRILQGQQWSRWFAGSVRYVSDTETVVHLPLEHGPAGDYVCQFDLRTPTGALVIPSQIRVPIVARYASGNLALPESTRDDWPHARFPDAVQPVAPWRLAWDMNRLYVDLVQPGIRKLTLHLLPGTSTDTMVELDLSGPSQWAEQTWAAMSAAPPQPGQVFRATWQDPLGQTREADVLFAGSGIEMYFGANIVSGEPGHDDQGPDPRLLRALYDQIGFDLRATGISWGTIEPDPPTAVEREFDLSPVRHLLDLHYPGMSYVTIALEGDWQAKLYDANPDQYYELARPYLDALTKELNRLGVRYVSCGWNEPELFHFSDRVGRFIRDLNETVHFVRQNMPDARIIAGKFCGGNPETIQIFTTGGLSDNFDVLDIHPYSNDPRTGCHMGEVVASHEALARAGMGDKRVYLGEGWGPTRTTPGVERLKHDAPVTDREADLQRRFFWNGYRCLVTPRDDYDPAWVLGAKYFTFNDNVGGTYWRVNARPHTNAQGEIDYYLLSHLRFDTLEEMKPFFCNGGLVDFQGQPKGPWLRDFPPSLPDVRVRVEHEIPHMLRGQSYPVTVHVTNAEPQALRNLQIGLRERTALFSAQGGQAQGGARSSTRRQTLEPGQTWTTRLTAKVVSGRTGPLRLALEADYEWQGRDYTSDAIIRTEIRDDVELLAESTVWTLDAGSGRYETDLKIRNNQRRPLSGALFDEVPRALKVETDPSIDRLQTGQEHPLAIRLDGSALPGGVYELPTRWDERVGVTVIKPLICPKLEGPIVVDGDLADWPKDRMGRGALDFRQALALPANTPAAAFPVPSPAGESVPNQVRSSIRSGSAKPDPGPPAGQPFAATANVMWDDQYLYFGAVVEDGKHVQALWGPDVWRGDSIQLAIDPKGDGGGVSPASFDDYRRRRNPEGHGSSYELAMALTPHGSGIAYVRGPETMSTEALEKSRLKVRRDGRFTTYELGLPWSAIEPVDAKPAARFRLSVLINNSDGETRSTLEWGGGIASGKYPSRFVPVILSE